MHKATFKKMLRRTYIPKKKYTHALKSVAVNRASKVATLLGDGAAAYVPSSKHSSIVSSNTNGSNVFYLFIFLYVVHDILALKRK